MSPFFKFIAVVIVAAVTIPTTAATYANWDDVRPYLIGDPSADGQLLYFARRG